MTQKLMFVSGLLLILLVSALGAQDFSIAIDAQKDAWYDGLTGPDDGYIYLPSRATTDATTAVPSGDSDISALIWLAWDEDFLYVYGEVKDDVILVNAAEWANDAIELKIDPDPTVADSTPAAAGSNVGARMTAFGEDNATCADGATCWDNVNTGCVTGAFACEMGDSVAITEEDWARDETDEGYVVEFRVPWPNITTEGRSVNVGVGNTFGLAINVNDNDAGSRETQLQWSAGVADAAWSDVRLLGTVEFLADHKLNLIPTNSSETNRQLLPCQVEGFENPANDSADVWYTPAVPGTGTTGDFAITIDAERDTWYDGLTGPEEGYTFISSRAGTEGFGPATDDTDLSASFWLAWDETYFYVYGEVTDDTLAVDNTAGGWENDGISVRINPNPNVADETPGNAGSVGTAEVTVFGTEDPRATGAALNLEAYPNADFARQDFAGSYAIEFRLPWADVTNEGRTVNAEVDSIFGLALVVGDNDAGNRAHQIAWSAVMDDATWRDAEMLGTAKFLADNKIELIPVNSSACPAPTPPTFATNDSAAVWYDPALISSVAGSAGNLPDAFGLAQNYPNPFNPTTNIEYTLKTAELVTISIYNVNGQLIRNLVSNQRYQAGTHQVSWDGKNDGGVSVSTGVYMYKITSDSFTQTKKMLLVK